MKLALLASLCLITLLQAQCPADYALPDLEAGTLQFALSNATPNSSQNIQYTLERTFTSTPSVALALQDFSVSKVGAHAFYVSPTQISNTVIVFTLAYTVPIWTKIRFNFWASANPQIQVGTFSAINLTPSNNMATAQTTIKNAFSASAQPVVRVFINGYMAASQTVQLAVTPSNIESTTLSVRIMMGAATQVRSVWLSYIAFTPSTASFTAYGGTISKNTFSGSFSQDISNSIYRTPYLLYGLTQLSLDGSSALVYQNTIDQSFGLKMQSSRQFDILGLMYIVIGKMPGQICDNCGIYRNLYQQQCMRTCPVGTTAKMFKDGATACMDNAVSSATAQSSSTVLPNSGPAVTTSQTTTTMIQTTTISSQCPGNSFFNGYQCVCEVGYGYFGGKCVALNINAPTPVIVNNGNTGSTQTSSSGTTSSTGSFSTSTGSSSTASGSSSSSTSSSSSSSGSSSTTSAPTPSTPSPVRPSASTISCPSNSYNNGLGTCICSSGYYLSNNQCISGTPCPAGSTRQNDGSCKCNTGYTNYDGVCSRCPAGAIYSSTNQQCIYVCGQNSMYSEKTLKCQCLSGYALLNDQCQICPQNYFISNGYCVTCPVNSQINPKTNKCDCIAGYYTNQFGICTQKCQTNEEYDSSSLKCVCLKGLARISGVCTVCPQGSVALADGSGCNSCGVNEQLNNGKCVCLNGYAYNSARVCTVCGQLPNGFILKGICSTCPKGTVFDGISACICPQGKIRQGLSCVSQCQSDQLLDPNGNCYTCGVNQMISNDKCVCARGYQQNACGICVLACTSGQFPFQGGCAVCPLNTVYNPLINGCGCPDGQYKDNYGVCQQIVLRPIQCPETQYFDSKQGCVACPGSCKSCTTGGKCLTCAVNGYKANSLGVCVTNCGDGLVLGAQSCDTGNTYSPGCVSCQIQSGYTCSGQPSVCRANTPVVTPVTPATPVPNPPSTPIVPTTSRALYHTDITLNSNNVFITLKTTPTFTFDNPTQMQQFMKTSFASGAKPTVYCSQQPSPDLDTFGCLLIYPAGVPNQTFKVNFSYNYQGKIGATTVEIDPFSVSNSRVSRTNSRDRN